MNRRDFLAQLRDFCVFYGIHGILSENAFAQEASPKNLINFVVKYTGGTTVEDGAGQWTFENTLKALAPFSADIMIPLGLNAKFKAPMNSHASPQISALSGSMTGFVLAETYYPKGNLENFSTGGGKSVDILVGEKLQKDYKTKLANLNISNDRRYVAHYGFGASSWGAGGVLLKSNGRIKDVADIIKGQLTCEQLSAEVYKKRLRALSYIKRNNQIFQSGNLINKEKFEKIKFFTEKSVNKYDESLANLSSGVTDCSFYEKMANFKLANSSSGTKEDFLSKMERMYDLAIVALEKNVTRSITFNLHSFLGHGNSHWLGAPVKEKGYYEIAQAYNQSVASFLDRLKGKGLYDDTLVYCNAGSCMSRNVHNYENLSAYIVNGGRSGVIGSTSNPKPIGSLLLDVLNKFGINYTEYGGRDHIYGVGKKGGFI